MIPGSAGLWAHLVLVLVLALRHHFPQFRTTFSAASWLLPCGDPCGGRESYDLTDCFLATLSSSTISVWYPQRAQDHRVSTVRTSRDRENTGCEGVEGGQV